MHFAWACKGEFKLLISMTKSPKDLGKDAFYSVPFHMHLRKACPLYRLKVAVATYPQDAS